MPRLVADATGTTVWRWDPVEPFANNPADENPSALGIFHVPLRLPGQYYDRETIARCNLMRDYAPRLGRYLESDAIGMTSVTLMLPSTRASRVRNNRNA